jgi:hypothetical protein
MNKSCEKKPTAHSQNMLHVDVLYTIKRKKYKTVCAEYKHYKGFVHFNYTYKLLFIALFDDFNLIISIFHCLCPSFYPYLSNR